MANQLAGATNFRPVRMKKTESCHLRVMMTYDRFNQYRWDKIRKKVGLADLKFHDLHKTFGSVLAQNGVSTAITQKLLEHSSPDLTNKVYTNVDPVLCHAVD
jgi:integrase